MDVITGYNTPKLLEVKVVSTLEFRRTGMAFLYTISIEHWFANGITKSPVQYRIWSIE